MDDNGQPIILPDGTLSFIQVTAEDSLELISSEDIAAIDKLSHSPIPSSNMELCNEQYAALLRAARAGKLIVFAAGNSNILYYFPSKNPCLVLFKYCLTHFHLLSYAKMFTILRLV